MQTPTMSSWYVGPFGRFLPVVKDLPKLSEYAMGEPPHGSPFILSSHQQSSPKRPVTLEFGTDTTLKSPPQSAPAPAPARCEYMLSPDPPSPAKEDELGSLELLPSETQLLTPCSPSSLPGSPEASKARVAFSASPNITSAQLFSPVDGTVSEAQVLSGLSSHDFPKDTGATTAETVTATLASQPLTPIYEQTYYPPMESETRTFSLGIEHPLSQGARPFTPPEMDCPISRYHQGQLPYHPNLPNAETPPGSDRAGVGCDVLPPPPHPLLPHVVDEQVVEGEGICYIYSDGSYCPKTIDGEPVNANWGVTKAGKPRKRLAQACITCREKKIKCHPNLPKCDQCQKSGRVCRFMSAPRGNKSSKKSQSLRKTRTTGAKDGFAANSPNLQYPPKIKTKTTTNYNTNNINSYFGPPSPSASPTSLSPISGRSLSLYTPPTDELLPPNHFPELVQPPKRRK